MVLYSWFYKSLWVVRARGQVAGSGIDLQVLLAVFTNAAFLTLRLPGSTAITSMENQRMMSPRPARLRDAFHESEFSLQHILLVNQSDTVRYTENVSIHSYPLFAEAY